MSPAALPGFGFAVGRTSSHGWGIHHFCGAMAYRPLHRKVGLGA